MLTRHMFHAVRTRFSFWIGLLLGAIALFLSLRRVEWTDTWSTLQNANGYLILLAIFSVVVTTFLKTLRWTSLLAPDRVPCDSVFFALMAGQLVNALFPGRLGEATRIYLLGEVKRLGKLKVLGTIIVEKFLDVMMLLGLFLLLLAGVPFPSWLRPWALPLGGLSILLLVLVVLAPRCWDLFACFLTSHPSIAPVAQGWLQALSQSMDNVSILRQPGKLRRAMTWTIIIWVMAVSTNYVLLRTFHLQRHLPPSISLTILVALHLGSLFPITPAQIGVFHYICIRLLTSFGVERSVSLSFAFILHLVVYLPMALFGSLGLGREVLHSAPSTRRN